MLFKARKIMIIKIYVGSEIGPLLMQVIFSDQSVTTVEPWLSRPFCSSDLMDKKKARRSNGLTVPIFALVRS